MFSLASIGTITACLFIFGIFYFVLSNFRYMVTKAETSVGVTVFFEENITDTEKRDIGTKIQARPEVSSLTYTSADEAWAKFKSESLKPELAETFGDDNPLAGSDSYSVFLKDVSKQSDLVTYIETLPGVRKVNGSSATANGLTAFNSMIGFVGFVILAILLAVSIFLINTTISMGISVRKEEISIMRLIGATDFFVRAPFVIEGMIIGCLGAVIPLAVLRLIYGKVITALSERYNSLANLLTFIPANEEFKTLAPLCILIGLGIGFLGSMFTVHRNRGV